MFLKNIKLKNWKQFEGEHEFSFDKITFVQGKNGIGKSNLSLNAILFALYGYTGKVKQKDLPTYKKKSCSVELDIDYNGNHYSIIREVPTKLTILQNNTEIQWKENGIKEKDLFIANLFGNIEHFKKFRIIDGYDKEINFLEQGNTTLKKILTTVNENLINEIRNELVNRKNTIQSYLSAQKKVSIPNYVSNKRLELINLLIQKIENDIKSLEGEINVFQKELRELSERRGILTYSFNECKRQLEKSKQSVCYACKQPIPKEKRERIAKRAMNEMVKIKKEFITVNESIEELESIIADLKEEKNKLNKRLMKIQQKKSLIQQKMQIINKYTEKDLLIAKKAVEVFENFVAEYLVYSIKSLEPIINSVLEKIGFKVTFEADLRKFNLILTDNQDRSWSYHHLSTGQKLLLQIALKTALLLQKGESGLIIADEGMGSLDEENLIYIIELFENLPFQLIMILHHFKNLPSFVNVIDLDNYFGK